MATKIPLNFIGKEVGELEEKRLQIKEMLFRNTLTQSWLINRLQEYGVKTDKTELSAILNGRRKGNKVTLVLDTSLLILRDYEEKMGVKEA